MDGVLDARFDTLPPLPIDFGDKRSWCKFTVACFPFSEVLSYFRDAHVEPSPLLVVRDVRAVFNSLICKTYGRNGITADDPPIRLRLRRFLNDWNEFQERGWPALSFEALLASPEVELREACRKLNLDWDPAMISWPKSVDNIADAKYGNETFIQNRSATLLTTIRPKLAGISTQNIPPQDLDWMETEFAEMNRAMGYPEHVPRTPTTHGRPARAVPCFENTRRCERLKRKHRWSRALRDFGQRVGGFVARTRQGACAPEASHSQREVRRTV